MATKVESTANAYINHEPTYHNDQHATYALPNDAPEHERLETQARHLSAIMNNQIIHAPIPPSIQAARMLDVGCGTGIVTDELGTRFPSAQVYGLDLSAVPELRPRPSNVSFLQGNILIDSPSRWLSPETHSGPFSSAQESGLFDFVFSRLLVAGLNNWPGYVRKVHALLKPGAYAEFHDIDWVWFKNDPASGQTAIISNKWRWLQLLNQAAQAKGMNLQPTAMLDSWMKKAGFEDIQMKEYRWPMGGQWEKDEVWKAWGDFVPEDLVWLSWHMIPRLLGSSFGDDDIRELREEMKKCAEPEEGKYWVMRVFVGRKPE